MKRDAETCKWLKQKWPYTHSAFSVSLLHLNQSQLDGSSRTAHINEPYTLLPTLSCYLAASTGLAHQTASTQSCTPDTIKPSNQKISKKMSIHIQTNVKQHEFNNTCNMCLQLQRIADYHIKGTRISCIYVRTYICTYMCMVVF